MFGDWTNRIPQICQTFQSASPFSHVVINNFFDEETVNTLRTEFPDPDNSSSGNFDWKHYDNPIEQKYALNDFSNLQHASSVFNFLQSAEVVDIFKQITHIENLEADPHLHGAGLHAYPHNGKLDMHLDYCIHPISGKERRVNLIVYLNKHWPSEYGGSLWLTDRPDLSNCVEVTQPGW
jgi:Rps23 Pro-64 3,4-dihydroxylase Tpa1-like proline 4-hydroxylase